MNKMKGVLDYLPSQKKEITGFVNKLVSYYDHLPKPLGHFLAFSIISSDLKYILEEEDLTTSVIEEVLVKVEKKDFPSVNGISRFTVDTKSNHVIIQYGELKLEWIIRDLPFRDFTGTAVIEISPGYALTTPEKRTIGLSFVAVERLLTQKRINQLCNSQADSISALNRQNEIILKDIALLKKYIVKDDKVKVPFDRPGHGGLGISLLLLFFLLSRKK